MFAHPTSKLFKYVSTRLLNWRRAAAPSFVAVLFLSFVIVGSAVSAGYFATSNINNSKHVGPATGKNNRALEMRRASTSASFLNQNDSPVTLRTDKSDYQPGEFVKVSGSGWFPGEVVNLVFHERLEEPFHTDETLIAIADGDGNISNDQYELEAHDRGVAYIIKATGTQSGYFAQVYFSDASAASLEQCANGSLTSPDATPCQGGDAGSEGWVNGNLGSSKSHYSEGDSISYRMMFSGLALSSHMVTIEWDTTKNGKHAIDYLTTYNRTVDSNPCEGVSGCDQNVFSASAIPPDTQVTGAGVTQIAGEFRLFGGTITNVSGYSYNDGAGFAGDKTARITITFDASTDNPVLAWGGHIATRLDWGATNSAVSIDGSPYHTRLIDIDGGGGNQDRSVDAAAVTFPSSITIIKNTVPDGPRDFDFSATGGLTPSSFTLDDDSDPTNSNTQVFSNILVTATNGNDYSVTETPVFGWDLSFGNPVCTVTSANGGSQSATTNGVSINLREGENVTCTFINTEDFTKTKGKIKVVKQTLPDGSSQSFQFTASYDANGFSLTDNGSNTSDNLTPSAENPGTYSVTEAPVAGWTSDGGVCDNGTPNNITVVAGQTTTCTFTNTKTPKLTVIKHVINDNGGNKAASDFTMSVTATNPSSSSFAGAESPGTTITLDAGSYNVTESGPSGYSQSSSADCSGAIAPGDEKTCTITNDDEAGTLVVKKVVINDNGGTKIATDFSFQVNGGSTTAFLQDGADTLKGKNSLTVDAGTYSVTEPAVSGYTTTYDNCTNVAVGNGETKTCTITNDDQPGTLIVKKVVINDNGGAKIATDFSFQVNGGSATAFLQDGADTLKGKNTLTVNAGTYSVTEPAVSGYTTSYYNCSNVAVGNGETKTCTITNNDQPGTLIVKKIVINDNGGTKIATHFSFKVNGGSATSFLQDGADTLKGKNTLTLNAGTYSVTEPAVYAYTATYDNCTNVVVGNGQEQTCTITNNDQPGRVIIEKLIKPAGSPTSFTFQTTGTGYNGFSLSGGQSNTQTLNAGTYTAKELVPLGWVLTGIGGSGDPNTPYNCVVTGSGGSTGVGDLDTQTVSITLKIGDTVKCTFENTGQGATRTQGFWATHPQLANIAWFGGTDFGHTFPGVSSVAGIGNTTLCTPVKKDVNSLAKLTGGFWSDISKTSTGAKRSATDQARVQLLQQLLAAELNASAFGSVPVSGSFSAWEAAYCSGNANDLKTAQQQAALFNSNGDSSQFTPGTSADSKTARSIADLVFWNVLP